MLAISGRDWRNLCLRCIFCEAGIIFWSPRSSSGNLSIVCTKSKAMHCSMWMCVICTGVIFSASLLYNTRPERGSCDTNYQRLPHKLSLTVICPICWQHCHIISGIRLTRSWFDQGGGLRISLKCRMYVVASFGKIAYRLPFSNLGCVAAFWIPDLRFGPLYGNAWWEVSIECDTNSYGNAL